MLFLCTYIERERRTDGKRFSPPKGIRISLLGGRGKTFEPTDKPDYSTMSDEELLEIMSQSVLD